MLTNYLISRLAPNWLTNVKVIDLGHVHTVPIDYRSVPKTISDRPSVHIWPRQSGAIPVTITSWNALILKVIPSVSDSFLERSAPNVNDLFSGSPPFLERNLIIALLGLEGRFAFARPKQISIPYGVNSSAPDLPGSISPSTVHIVSDRFQTRTENRSEHRLNYMLCIVYQI